MYEGASKQYQNPMKSTALTEPHNQQFIRVSRPKHVDNNNRDG